MYRCNLFAVRPTTTSMAMTANRLANARYVAVGRIDACAGRGIRGDRFFNYKPDYKGQITFFAMEVIEALARELNLAGVRPELTRRNVFTRGADPRHP